MANPFEMIAETVANMGNSDLVIEFVNHNLLMLVFVSLAFGFAGLLVEVRLPLKFYWDLPSYFMRPFFVALGILKKTPLWGKCLDNETSYPIPLTAIELLRKDNLMLIKTTFSDRVGDYGFDIKPGDYVVRAVKKNYIAPPFFDPENIQLKSTDESLALPISVIEGQVPQLNLVLQPTSVENLSGFWYKLWFYFRAFSINLANGFLVLAVVNSWYGWVVQRSALFAILLATAIVFMFVKLYILETVGSASRA